jgi:hypothetical protein
MVSIDAQVSAKPHSFRNFFGRTMGLLTKAKTRHHLTNDIDDIKKRINDVAARRERYNRLERVAAQPDTTVDQHRAIFLENEKVRLFTPNEATVITEFIKVPQQIK